MKIRLRFLSLALAALLLPFTSPVLAATVSAATCARADVSTAITSAADGDTVRIPAGSCTWGSGISTSKGITILGAGQGSTIITSGGFDMSTPSGKSFRISGFTLRGTSGFAVYGESKAFRIDHITFDNLSSGRVENRHIWINPDNAGYVQGVIDHNTFTEPRGIQVHYRGSDKDGGNTQWIRALGLGGPDAVYIEDNLFNNTNYSVSDPLTDCDGGGRLVFRHNTVKNSYFEMHDAIIAGLRGCRKWEVYENSFEMTYAAGMCSFIAMRGGTGVVFNNTFLSTTDCYPEIIQMTVYRTYQTETDPWNQLCSANTGMACLGSSSAAPKSCTSDSGCGGVAGSCIKIDGTASSPSGWPCRDQTGSDGNNPQVGKPALYWNNKHGSEFVNPVVWGSTVASYLQRDKDYCFGTTSMPTSCNGKTVDYTPYAYPHPLTVDGPRPLPPKVL
jgi:hypothetical protein